MWATMPMEPISRKLTTLCITTTIIWDNTILIIMAMRTFAIIVSHLHQQVNIRLWPNPLGLGKTSEVRVLPTFRIFPSQHLFCPGLLEWQMWFLKKKTLFQTLISYSLKPGDILWPFPDSFGFGTLSRRGKKFIESQVELLFDWEWVITKGNFESRLTLCTHYHNVCSNNHLEWSCFLFRRPVLLQVRLIFLPLVFYLVLKSECLPINISAMSPSS